jgi:sugar transferase EpsL
MKAKFSKKRFFSTSALISHHIDFHRSLDVAAVLLVSIPVSATILFMMAAIAVTSGGPVIFRQRRIGLNGKPFTMFKLSTMTEACDSCGTLLPEDVRITKLGHFMRDSGINEFPQFFNILKGDMSLIGPRPWPVTSGIPDWEKRHVVRPGLTGLSQVLEKEAGIQPSPEVFLQYDLEYIKTWTVVSDLNLLWRTARVVMTGQVDVPNRAKAKSQVQANFFDQACE